MKTRSGRSTSMKRRRGRPTNNSTPLKNPKKQSLTKPATTTSLYPFDNFYFNDVLLRLKIIPNDDSDSPPATQVKTFNASSHILSTTSVFFYKLLRNGMKESYSGNDLTLTIYGHEEEALMDVINFMYEHTLKAISLSDLVDVLVVADKFEVASCMRYCVERLLKLPMSRETALVYLTLPSCVLMSKIVRPIVDASTRYFVLHFDEFIEFNKKAALSELTLSTVEMILGTEGLNLVSEDDVFDFISEWTRTSYPNVKERQEIISNHLIKFICFSNLSISKLKEAIVCPEFDQLHVSNLVTEALLNQSEHNQAQVLSDSKDLARTYKSFLGRVYAPRCMVYFHPTKQEFDRLYPSNVLIMSNSFRLGGNSFYLCARFWEQGEEHYLGLFLMKSKGALDCSVEYEFSVMNKSSMEFEVKCKGKKTTLDDSSWGIKNTLGITWNQLKNSDNDYFINGALHFRAQITLI